MAITIGVCDDNPGQVGLLIQYINSNRSADGCRIVDSTDPEEFLILFRDKRPQLVFLDIDMGGTSGIQLGEKIRAICEDTVIVYITAYEKYALEAFGVRAFHYLLKPLTIEKFDEVLEECIRFIEKTSSVKQEQALTIRTKKEAIRLDFGDIGYFEKTGHKIKIHTRTRDLFYYDNFTNLLSALDLGVFVQCHQGYIANVSQIRGFRDKTLFLDGGVELPVSRSYAEAVKKTLAERLFAGKDAI